MVPHGAMPTNTRRGLPLLSLLAFSLMMLDVFIMCVFSVCVYLVVISKTMQRKHESMRLAR